MMKWLVGEKIFYFTFIFTSIQVTVFTEIIIVKASFT